MVDKIYLGRRKTSVARVILRNGSGNVKVNGSEFEKAFPQLISRDDILSSFKRLIESKESRYEKYVASFTSAEEKVCIALAKNDIVKKAHIYAQKLYEQFEICSPDAPMKSKYP